MFVAISKHQQQAAIKATLAAFTFFDLIPSEIRLVLLVYQFLGTLSRSQETMSGNMRLFLWLQLILVFQCLMTPTTSQGSESQSAEDSLQTVPQESIKHG